MMTGLRLEGKVEIAISIVATLSLTSDVTLGNNCKVYKVVTTKFFANQLSRIPVNWQKRIVGKIKEIAAAPYAKHNNVAKLQGRSGYRLRIGNWRVIYELHDERLELWALDVGARGGIY
jgi:mRNA interferase RelE/StbE